MPAIVFTALMGQEPENIPSAFTGQLGGIRMNLFISSLTGNHKDVPLLGQDYLTKIGARLVVDYDEDTVVMTAKRIRM